ncbi:hypothetical protein HXX76_014828 [Chlamydomonas incerta]|uniref:Uncharacterized protein n=1 Tax=Chlamydomonas incerta TaxID=51695 RepID=A0A835VP43_CHLIN|nr:hypothetical protein HXX76_014828 [Chlamydomonas incerta]|eukprot:KAG2424002.1 hypothetical protein HXX76_014828 [Chlamydomonas incerta]
MIDFSFSPGKLHFGPNVTFAIHDLEIRNARSQQGFSVDILNASPGATLELRGVIFFAFACLQLEVTLAAMRSYSRPHSADWDASSSSSPSPPGGGASPSNSSSTQSSSSHTTAQQQQQQQQQVVLAGRWCRTTPGIARCYSPTLKLEDIALAVPLLERPGGGSAGGYVLRVLDSAVACEGTLDLAASCGLTPATAAAGLDECVSAKRQQMWAADDTWKRLADQHAGGRRSAGGDADDGGSGDGLSDGQIAGIVVGSVVAGVLLLAAVVFGFMWARRTAGSRHQQPAGGDPATAAATATAAVGGSATGAAAAAAAKGDAVSPAAPGSSKSGAGSGADGGVVVANAATAAVTVEVGSQGKQQGDAVKPPAPALAAPAALASSPAVAVAVRGSSRAPRTADAHQAPDATALQNVRLWLAAQDQV